MNDFEDLAPDVEAELVDTARRYLRAFGVQLRGVTPQGTGDLARSYRYVVAGVEHSDVGQAAAAIRTLNDDVEVLSLDPAYPVLDLGVHLSSDGRRRGSSKAPRGLTGPSVSAADRVAGSRP